MVIQRLLREAGRDGIADDLVSVAPDGFEAQADWANLESPETLPRLRARPELRVAGGRRARRAARPTRAGPLRLNQWALAGDWTIESRASVLEPSRGRIAFRFHARDVHLVMGRARAARPCRSACSSTASRPATRTGSTSTSRATERSPNSGSTS